MKKRYLAAAVAAASLVVAAGPAAAISDGELDGDDHPYVGIMIHVDEHGDRQWRCSGALISPTVFVTAGHCVAQADNSPIANAVVWFEPDLEPDPAIYGYRDEYEVDELDRPVDTGIGIRGTAHVHPLYDDGAFFLHDLGVVVLDEPFVLDAYARIPAADEIGMVDGFRMGRKNGTTVTAVGYGLQELVEGPIHFDFDPKLQADKTRYRAEVDVVSTKGAGGVGSKSNPIATSGSFLTSGNPTTGGTCPGDSGGPNLYGEDNVIVGVTSFGFNFNCKGLGGVYRIDQLDDVEFINSFLDD